MKYNYFEALDSLSVRVYDAVSSACSERGIVSEKSLAQIRGGFNSALLELETSLFGEFIPPLKRDNIAAYAHALSRVTDTACEHIALKLSHGSIGKRLSEEDICIELAKLIHDGTSMLKSLRKPDIMPDIKSFREYSRKGLEAHTASLAQISRGALPKSYLQPLISAGKLRSELSVCFDVLLETMFNNI
ncbi:MAG: hypothetical protein IJV72_07330 [Clostridia bacterium]|nr:hypothetical protein [Clostridia bacterium]